MRINDKEIKVGKIAFYVVFSLLLFLGTLVFNIYIAYYFLMYLLMESIKQL